MKTGLTIMQMATEMERRQETKRDFVADTTQLNMRPDSNLGMTVGGTYMEFGTNETFRRQAHSHYKVPQEYGDRIRLAHPQLYADTLNTFFQGETSRQMVRTLDGNARAFLSDRYRPLDDYDLMAAVLPEIMGFPQMRVESAQFTESRFYLKALSPRIETEITVGDPVQMGLVISNSEVGAGALQVMPLIYRLVCKNGMISQDYGQRRHHIGKRASAEETSFELYSDRTKKLDDAAFFAKVKDTVRGVLSYDVLNAIAQKMRDAKEQKIAGVHIQNVVEITSKRFGYSETTSSGIFRHLIEGGDLTRYGLMNAITRQSQDEGDYDTATRLEMDGSKIIELPRTDWEQIAESALAKAA